MHADTSDIHALSLAHHHRCADLTAVAADLAAVQVSPGAFGPVGAGFLATLNDALVHEARYTERLAECLANAAIAAESAATDYVATEVRSGQALSTLGS